jgi:hypothetical protein
MASLLSTLETAAAKKNTTVNMLPAAALSLVNNRPASASSSPDRRTQAAMTMIPAMAARGLTRLRYA